MSSMTLWLDTSTSSADSIAAALAIFVRIAFRLDALGMAFTSHLANNEVTFTFLEGAMAVIATVGLIIFHLGLCSDGERDRPVLRLPKSHYRLSNRPNHRSAVWSVTLQAWFVI